MDYGLYENYISRMARTSDLTDMVWCSLSQKNSPIHLSWRILLGIFLTINENLRLTS